MSRMKARRKRSVTDEEDKDCPELSELSLMKYEILKTGGEGELYNSDGSTIKVVPSAYYLIILTKL